MAVIEDSERASTGARGSPETASPSPAASIFGMGCGGEILKWNGLRRQLRSEIQARRGRAAIELDHQKAKNKRKKKEAGRETNKRRGEAGENAKKMCRSSSGSHTRDGDGEDQNKERSERSRSG